MEFKPRGAVPAAEFRPFSPPRERVHKGLTQPARWVRLVRRRLRTPASPDELDPLPHPLSSGRPRVIFMMKAPREGEVKTRLAAEIGDANATALYRRFVEFLCERLFSDAGASWETVIACAPAAAVDEIREWLAPRAHAGVRFEPQAEGDLGFRLERQFAEAFDEGAPAVLALGTDCLEVTADEIEDCFGDLESRDLVLGEAFDGGYWCIGMAAPHFELFRKMPWSQANLCARTREKARTLGIRIAERARRLDVDEKSDLKRLPPELIEAARLDERLWDAPRTGASERPAAGQ